MSFLETVLLLSLVAGGIILYVQHKEHKERAKLKKTNSSRPTPPGKDAGPKRPK